MISDFGLGKWNWYNRSKYKDFWMGPSVKFVSRINGSFSPQKIMGQLFSRKKGQTGGKGGPRGVCQKGTIFPDFFSAPFPKTTVKSVFSTYFINCAVYFDQYFSLCVSKRGHTYCRAMQRWEKVSHQDLSHAGQTLGTWAESLPILYILTSPTIHCTTLLQLLLTLLQTLPNNTNSLKPLFSSNF